MLTQIVSDPGNKANGAVDGLKRYIAVLPTGLQIQTDWWLLTVLPRQPQVISEV